MIMINNTILFHTVLKNNMSNDKTFQINKNNESQKLYLVYGDTEYETAYGISINIFGVFDTKEKAIQQKRKKKKNIKNWQQIIIMILIINLLIFLFQY